MNPALTDKQHEELIERLEALQISESFLRFELARKWSDATRKDFESQLAGVIAERSKIVRKLTPSDPAWSILDRIKKSLTEGAYKKELRAA